MKEEAIREYMVRVGCRGMGDSQLSRVKVGLEVAILKDYAIPHGVEACCIGMLGYSFRDPSNCRKR